MSQAILWKMVYPEGGEGVPWNEYLHWNAPFLSLPEKWEWKKELEGAHIFLSESEYEAKIQEFNDHHVHPLIYGETLVARLKEIVTPEKCYQMTLRRLGERD